VAVPYSLSFKKTEEFVHAKRGWIKKQLEKMKQYEKKQNCKLGNTLYIDKAKAAKTLIKRLKWLASRYSFSYRRVFIRNQKTRWGSCSSKNNISLNMKLVRLPDELVDYVILHELVHTIIKNHGKVFWAEMDKFVGNGKQMSSRLRSYGIQLF
jgi:predicted metal-dependent hydrolase